MVWIVVSYARNVFPSSNCSACLAPLAAAVVHQFRNYLCVVRYSLYVAQNWNCAVQGNWCVQCIAYVLSHPSSSVFAECFQQNFVILPWHVINAISHEHQQIKKLMWHAASCSVYASLHTAQLLTHRILLYALVEIIRQLWCRCRR